MPVNEYDSPLIAQSRQSYVSQHVELPFQMIQNDINRKQGEYNNAEKLKAMMEATEASVKAVKKDEEKRDGRIAMYETKLQDILDETNGDYGAAMSQIKGQASLLDKEMKLGTLGKIQSNYNSTAAYNAAMQKGVDDGRYTQEKANDLMSISSQLYKGVQQETYHGQDMNAFSGVNAVDDVNTAELVDAAIKDHAEHEMSNGNWGESNGRYYKKTTTGRVWLTPAEIRKTVEGSLANNPKYMSYMNQQAQLNAYHETGDPASMEDPTLIKKHKGLLLESANSLAVSKYKKDNWTKDEDIKLDTEAANMRLMRAKHELENPTLPILEKNSEVIEMKSAAGANMEEIKGKAAGYRENISAETNQLYVSELEGLQAEIETVEDAGGDASKLKQELSTLQGMATNGQLNNATSFLKLIEGDPNSLSHIDSKYKKDLINNIHNTQGRLHAQNQVIDAADKAVEQRMGMTKEEYVDKAYAAEIDKLRETKSKDRSAWTDGRIPKDLTTAEIIALSKNPAESKNGYKVEMKKQHGISTIKIIDKEGNQVFADQKLGDSYFTNAEEAWEDNTEDMYDEWSADQERVVYASIKDKDQLVIYGADGNIDTEGTKVITAAAQKEFFNGSKLNLSAWSGLTASFMSGDEDEIGQTTQDALERVQEALNLSDEEVQNLEGTVSYNTDFVGGGPAYMTLTARDPKSNESTTLRVDLGDSGITSTEINAFINSSASQAKRVLNKATTYGANVDLLQTMEGKPSGFIIVNNVTDDNGKSVPGVRTPDGTIIKGSDAVKAIANGIENGRFKVIK